MLKRVLGTCAALLVLSALPILGQEAGGDAQGTGEGLGFGLGAVRGRG